MRGIVMGFPYCLFSLKWNYVHFDFEIEMEGFLDIIGYLWVSDERILLFSYLIVVNYLLFYQICRHLSINVTVLLGANVTNINFNHILLITIYTLVVVDNFCVLVHRIQTKHFVTETRFNPIQVLTFYSIKVKVTYSLLPPTN